MALNAVVICVRDVNGRSSNLDGVEKASAYDNMRRANISTKKIDVVLAVSKLMHYAFTYNSNVYAMITLHAAIKVGRCTYGVNV